MTANWLVKIGAGRLLAGTSRSERPSSPGPGCGTTRRRRNLKAMRKGDLAFFYHSNVGKEIVGVVEVAREAYPDPTADTPRRLGLRRYEGGRADAAADLLAAIKADGRFADIAASQAAAALGHAR